MNNCPSPPFHQIPEEMNHCRNSYVEQALLPRRLEELASEEAGQRGYRAYLQESLDALLKEAKDKFRGYDSCSTPEHVELAYKKVNTVFTHQLWLVHFISFLHASFQLFHMDTVSAFVCDRSWVQWSIGCKVKAMGFISLIKERKSWSLISLSLVCKKATIHEAHGVL